MLFRRYRAAARRMKHGPTDGRCHCLRARTRPPELPAFLAARNLTYARGAVPHERDRDSIGP